MKDFRKLLRDAKILILFKNENLLLAPEKPNPMNIKGYYNHSEYILMPRTNKPAKINLREDLTDSLELFLLFYISQHVRSFTNTINIYARAEFKRKPTSRIRDLY